MGPLSVLIERLTLMGVVCWLRHQMEDQVMQNWLQILVVHTVKVWNLKIVLGLQLGIGVVELLVGTRNLRVWFSGLQLRRFALYIHNVASYNFIFGFLWVVFFKCEMKGMIRNMSKVRERKFCLINSSCGKDFSNYFLNPDMLELKRAWQNEK